MHPDLLALLDAVRDDPGDDTVRLVLADWLQEFGRDDAERARAEFIRLQCQKARLFAETWDFRIVSALPKYQELAAQEALLRRTHLSSWLGEWKPHIMRPDTDETWFERGMMRPWVRGLDGIPHDPSVWAWVDGLVILSPTLEGVENLTGSPLMGRLNALDFGPDSWADDADIGDAGARAIASSPYLTQLTSLVLTDTGIGAEGAKAIAESRRLATLTSLELLGFDCTRSNHIGNGGARALAESPHMARLTRLRLPENGIGVDGAKAIAESVHLSGLTYLELSANPIGPEGARALAASPYLNRLTYLGLELSTSRDRSAGVRADAKEIEDASMILQQRFGAVWSGH